MDVFLVPVAPDRYELYCEEPDEPAPVAEDPTARSKGVIRRLVDGFREQLAEAEHARRHDTQPGEQRPLLARIKARFLRWIAESIAEQRLLWQLRSKDAALLIYPDDVTDTQARQLLKRSLQRDWERHRFWLVIDSLGGLGSALLILLPGPNFIGYYFVFRIVGHYLSLRGARKGMTGMTWTVQSSDALSSLRTVVNDPPDSREEHVRGVAAILRLEHFASFFQRTATS